MAGHSKWANIQHRKGAQDKKRAVLFARLSKEITIASKMGGPDPAMNPRLRLAVDKAIAGNMPNDTIDRAVKRGAGGEDTGNFDEIRYEGYAPGGIAVLVDCLTDNRNRTASEVRHAFTKHGGNLGTDGSVAYLFQKQGILTYAPGANAEALLELALELGAEDVVKHDVLTYEIVHKEPLIMVLPQQHPLANNSQVKLADFANERFILPCHKTVPALHEQTRIACVEAGFHPNVVQEATWMPTVLSLVASEMGVALLPANVINLQRTGVVYREITGKVPTFQMAMIWRQDNHSKILLNFLTD